MLGARITGKSIVFGTELKTSLRLSHIAGQPREFSTRFYRPETHELGLERLCANIMSSIGSGNQTFVDYDE